MRRHSTIPEKTHYQIHYKLQDQQNANGWVDLTNGRSQKHKKKKENLEIDGKMTATVLPARNAHNDYHVKYHSVSGGSALSQSMKYAEAWLYGSWNVRPSIRTAFLNFDHHEFTQATFDLTSSGSPIVCYCSQNCTTHNGKKKCKKCTTPPTKNFSAIQGFGTVRNNRVYRNLIHNDGDQCCKLKDPYDVVRQSRLSGIKCATVRAKSYSPSKRKQVTSLAGINRLPSPDVKLLSDDSMRRSILECNINPYELLKKSFEEDGSSLISDDDLLDACAGGAKASKKQRSTLRHKFKSRIQDSKPAKMLLENLKNMKKDDKSDTTTATPTTGAGVSIAGQKIRVFNTPTRPAPEPPRNSEDWITDPVEDEEEVMETASGGSVVAATETETSTVPKRPPRRKTPKISPPTNCPSPSSGIYQNYKVPVAKRASTPPPPPVAYSDIKSILKKPLATSSETNNVDAAAKLNNCGPSPADKSSPSGEDTSKNFYLTTFNGKRQIDRKVKKQVQFKGMQEHTVEDESGSYKPNVDVDAKIVAVAETGYSTENTTTSSSNTTTSTTTTEITTPEQAYSDHTLTIDDDKSNVERHLFDYGRKVTSSPLPPLIVNDERNQTSVNSFRSSSLAENVSVSVDGSKSDCAACNNRTQSAEPVSRLHRTLSECITPRPLFVNVQCEPFNDTMRLRIRANQQIDPKRLFQNGKGSVADRSINARRMCSRPAIPPPLPPTSCDLRPYLPPRQYFPFNKSENSVINKIANMRNPVVVTVNENVEKMYSETLQLIKENDVKIPSLTKTFLQNRTITPIGVEREKSSYASSSVIKINVTPQQSSVENRTIVTITPEEEKKSTWADTRTLVADTGIGSKNGGKTSITINFDERSPAQCQRPNNNTVTINVGYKEDGQESTQQNNYKSSIEVTPDKSEVYVKANEFSSSSCESNEISTQTDSIISLDPVQAIKRNLVPHICGCDKQSRMVVAKPKSDDSSDRENNTSGISGDSFEEETSAEEYCKNDFSLHYMSCKINERLTEDEVGLSIPESNRYDLAEPIYEEISETPPPLPLKPPPAKVDDIGIVIPPRSIFEGASKYDILKYLAGAKERCKIPEEPEFVVEEMADSEPSELPSSNHSRIGSSDLSSRLSHLSNVSDSSDELVNFLNATLEKTCRNSADIERNDSGVGSETSKCFRSKWQHMQASSLPEDQHHSCEDCDQPVEAQVSDSGLIYAPLVCRKCSKRRIERREIIAEIVETEEKYGRDLRIMLDEFYQPMLVAGLLSPDQLSSIFLNVEELLEHNTTLAEKLRDGYEIAIEQGDEDLLTFNVGKIFLDAAPMLHAFESYCTRQGNAALLLANLEKEKELLKIFLRVSQMENTVLRRMNLNSFLMVPVQRVTKYPLLLARLCKVTPDHHTAQRESLKEAQHNIELHLEHINSLTKDIGSTKIWRRISMMNGRRVSGDADDILNIKLQKIAVEVLEWGHDEVRFAMEGRLFYSQPTDYNWKRTGRTIKVIPVNALLVTLGKPTENYNPECDELLMFPQKNGIREASLLLMKEKGGKYSLVRDPLFLEHCVVYCDNDCEEYFEIQEIPSKDTYIFKGEDEERTKQWYKQLQYHSQGLGCWRRRRNALANIMINGMQVRN